MVNRGERRNDRAANRRSWSKVAVISALDGGEEADVGSVC